MSGTDPVTACRTAAGGWLLWCLACNDHLVTSFDPVADLFAAWHREHHAYGGSDGHAAAGVVLAFPSSADRSRREVP